MATIALIGAGSTGFAKPYMIDIMRRPAFAQATVRLMDVDGGRVELMARPARKIARQLGVGTKVEATTDQRRALDGADYVISVVLLHGVEPYAKALETALGHGPRVHQRRGMAEIDREPSRHAPRGGHRL